mmetsp:Transcript_5381/g.8354  ORF Transcript_5381/g.8354 Transcript_5381/m.8354 type:complete len:245 (+) Transcript_5381:615-1349(+)
MVVLLCIGNIAVEGSVSHSHCLLQALVHLLFSTGLFCFGGSVYLPSNDLEVFYWQLRNHLMFAPFTVDLQIGHIPYIELVNDRCEGCRMDGNIDSVICCYSSTSRVVCIPLDNKRPSVFCHPLIDWNHVCNAILKKIPPQKGIVSRHRLECVNLSVREFLSGQEREGPHVASYVDDSLSSVDVQGTKSIAVSVELIHYMIYARRLLVVPYFYRKSKPICLDHLGVLGQDRWVGGGKQLLLLLYN